jgi:AraC-like DNA-binding protein
MRFDFNFYSSILLIFFVHGLVYALLLYRKAIINTTVSDKWLSLFLILCILYIAPWMLGFAGWYDHQPYRDLIFYTPFQHLYFIGPVIFFYVQSLLNPSFHFRKKNLLHFIPGIFFLVLNLVIFFTDKVFLKRYYFYADGSDKDFDLWYQLSGFFSMVIYFLLSLKYYNLYKKLMLQVVSYAEVVLFKWVKNFLYAFLIMLLIKLLFFTASFIPYFESLRYIGPWWEYFSFAIILYYIAITGYSNSVQTKVHFKIHLLGHQKSLLLLQPGEPASIINETSYIEDAEIIPFETEQPVANKEEERLLTEWKPKILQLIHQDKAYEDPELSLAQVAKQLKTNPTIVSKIINQGFQLNFNDFINFYRIEAVKEKLKAGEQKTQTLLGIALDCGFNSKATFNRAFKKATGVSPKEWFEKNIL